MKSATYFRAVFAATASMATLGASQALAAEPNDNQGLDEIVVTARKRVENLQDVSSSVSALSSA